MTNKIAKTALRNISRNKRRSLLSGIAIGVAAMSIVMLFSIIAGMKDDMAVNLKTFYTGEVRIRHGEYDKYERYNPLHLTVDWDSAAEVLAANDAVAAYAPRIQFPANLYIEGANYGALGVGADFQREADFQGVSDVVRAGRLPRSGENEMLMGGLLARDLGLALGDKVTVMSTTAARGSNAITLEIVGLAAFPVGELNSQSFWVPLDRTQYFLRMNGGVQDVLIKTAEEADPRAVAQETADALEASTGAVYDVRSWTDISTAYGLFQMAQNIYYFIAAFFFLLGSTVIINTTMMVIFERMREIGTLGALGMHGKELVRLFFLEGAFISAIGSAAGVIIGIGLTLFLGRAGIDFTDALSGLDLEVSSVLYPRLSIVSTVVVFVYSVAIASCATLLPSRKAAKIEPVEALRYI